MKGGLWAIVFKTSQTSRRVIYLFDTKPSCTNFLTVVPNLLC